MQETALQTVKDAQTQSGGRRLPDAQCKNNQHSQRCAVQLSIDGSGEKVNAVALALRPHLQMTAEVSFASSCLLIVWPANTCSRGEFTTQPCSLCQCSHWFKNSFVKVDQLPGLASGSRSRLPYTGLCGLSLVHSHLNLPLGCAGFQRTYQGSVQQRGKQPDWQQSGWEMMGPGVLKATGNSTSRTHFIIQMRGSYPGTQCCQRLGHSWSTYCDWISTVKASLCVGDVFLFLHNTGVWSFEMYALTVLHIKYHHGKPHDFLLLLP